MVAPSCRVMQISPFTPPATLLAPGSRRCTGDTWCCWYPITNLSSLQDCKHCFCLHETCVSTVRWGPDCCSVCSHMQSFVEGDVGLRAGAADGILQSVHPSILRILLLPLCISTVMRLVVVPCMKCYKDWCWGWEYTHHGTSSLHVLS